MGRAVVEVLVVMPRWRRKSGAEGVLLLAC